MPRCEAAPVLWKGRRAFRLSNGIVEITVLLGGGHIADFRICGSPLNLLFESPWPTIEPNAFSSDRHTSTYGEGPVGRMLSGYTGHAVALGYFGMPTEEEAAAGLPLHGEAVALEWKVLNSVVDEHGALLSMEVLLPAYRLRFIRSLYLSDEASSVLIEEQVSNVGDDALNFQWVEHAAFGEPLFSPGNSRLFISAGQGRTWPLGYEGHELVAANADFRWPLTRTIDGAELDLSQPFTRTGTGFLVSLLTHTGSQNGFILIHNSEMNLAAGYVFDPQQFPWIALWEENQARAYAPWNGITRVRGVEFGNSPMPLGLKQAVEQGTLFQTPVFSTIEPGETLATTYHLFATEIPAHWSATFNVSATSDTLIVRGDRNQILTVRASNVS
jgi:hypothetical protein